MTEEYFTQFSMRPRENPMVWLVIQRYNNFDIKVVLGSVADEHHVLMTDNFLILKNESKALTLDI